MWFTVLAIVASVLSAGGIVSQVIAWKRARDEKRLEAEKAKHAGDVEKTKAEVEDAKHARDHTGRFQQRLIDRVEKLEKRDEERGKKIAGLEGANAKCQAENAELRSKIILLEGSNQRLAREHELLKQDYAQLKEHVDRLEAENRALRLRLARLDHGAGADTTVGREGIADGARAARGAVTRKQGG